MLTPKPGIYENVTYPEYFAWGAINQSRLMLMKKSAAHLKWAFDNERKPSEAFDTGHAIHSLVLEPEQFNNRYLLGIDGDGRTKEVKEARAKLEELANGRGILKPSEWDDAVRIAKAVNAHPKAREYLNSSRRELSIVWVDEPTKLLCKARIDGHSRKGGILSDLKSTIDASVESFAKSIFNFNYYNQAAFYCEGLRALDQEVNHFVFLAVEKTGPFGVGVYRLDEDVLSLGRRENADLMRKYATCAAKDEWPCYSQLVQDIGMPGWAIQKLEEKYAGQ